MDKREQNKEAVRRFREKEKKEKAEKEEVQRKKEAMMKENERKRREIEATNAQIRSTRNMFIEMANHNPSFGQHPTVQKYL